MLNRDEVLKDAPTPKSDDPDDPVAKTRRKLFFACTNLRKAEYSSFADVLGLQMDLFGNVSSATESRKRAAAGAAEGDPAAGASDGAVAGEDQETSITGPSL